MSQTIEIHDRRSDSPDDYQDYARRGRMKSSWQLGVERQRDGREVIAIEDGLTWGSIGQILGYLLGEVDEAEQDQLYERMLREYEKTDRGSRLRGSGEK